MMDVLVNNVLKEYGDVKEEIKNLKALNISQRLFSIYQTKLSYCLKYGKKTKGKNPRAAKTNKGKPILLSKCTECGSKKLRFIKE